ncbi:MAG: bifunctional [glutamine synthetase] adenylyltransferase/[glutamine synthetase]-adenylyl-L-tyrosine phosphorylase, partial [Rhizobiales bacterium]|nr:bifunctional [glutamine synthetase] adenylyltransferase/[glutamine synthetase]-adenylyl-L-tyrosine phosphorylase [Hyphomicrobiales bacterium]
MNSRAKGPVEILTAGEHSLAHRIVFATQRQSADQQSDLRLADWLSEISDTPVGKALATFFDAHPAVGALIAGLTDGSPYLWDLVRADPSRLTTVLATDPDAHFSALLAQTAQAVAATQNQDEAMRLLRRMKAEASLVIALVDIGGVWSVMQVTHALTELADTALRAAVNFLLADAARRGRLNPTDPVHPEIGSGYIVLAMGKMGAFELNYSSDIDLIVLFDPATPALADGVEISSFYVRLTRGLVKLLQQRTVDGYVFRVDLRLRPDPASTQIAISTPAALDYYESVGQNWERAALIKARACAGDIAAGEAVLKSLSPFIWRKYMDFVALADIHAMKRQIHAYRGHGEIAVAGHNIKLGRGGIREIEFFVQTQQLIAGGRYPDLRDRATLTTLAKLAQGEWINGQACEELKASYCFLRTVEHRLQMVNDEQIHTLPSDAVTLERFVRFLGFDDADKFAAALTGHLQKVQEHYVKLFEAAPATAPGQPGFVFAADADDRATLKMLSEMGFRNPLEASAYVRRWLTGGYSSLRSELAREQFRALIPALLEQFSRAEGRDEAIVSFDRFLAALHGGGRLFSLLRQNPALLRLIALMIGNAPRLADIL